MTFGNSATNHKPPTVAFYRSEYKTKVEKKTNKNVIIIRDRIPRWHSGKNRFYLHDIRRNPRAVSENVKTSAPHLSTNNIISFRIESWGGGYIKRDQHSTRNAELYNKATSQIINFFLAITPGFQTLKDYKKTTV